MAGNKIGNWHYFTPVNGSDIGPYGPTISDKWIRGRDTLQRSCNAAGVAHRDLKLENFLLTKGNVCDETCLLKLVAWRAWFLLISEPQQLVTRWWRLKDFLCSSRKLGKMNPFWRVVFQIGWNHQPEKWCKIIICIYIYTLRIMGSQN